MTYNSRIPQFLTQIVLNTQIRKISSERTLSEVRIPVPWGHIAGKWWGPKDKRPILAVHGWQDNAGTFDTLIPQLPPQTPILAIDLPGHGLSSRLPHGVMFHFVDMPLWYTYVFQFFNWSKISLMGHSMGGVGCLLFTAMFPHLVDFVVDIDSFIPFSPKIDILENNIKAIKMFIKYDKLNIKSAPPQSYTWEECQKRLVEGSSKSVSLEACKYLLKRNVQQLETDPNKFYFSRDPRLKASFYTPFSQEENIYYYRNITCPVLVIKADNSPYYGGKSNFLEIVELVKKNSNECRFVMVPGTHHVHLNNPNVLEDHINNFLKTHDTDPRIVDNVKEEIFI